MSKTESLETCMGLLNHAEAVLQAELGPFTDHLTSVYHSVLTILQLNPQRSQEMVEASRRAVAALIGIRDRYGRNSQSFLRMALFLVQFSASLNREYSNYDAICQELNSYEGSILDEAVASAQELFNQNAAGISTLVDAMVVKCSALLAKQTPEAVHEAKNLLVKLLEQTESSWSPCVFLAWSSLNYLLVLPQKLRERNDVLCKDSTI